MWGDLSPAPATVLVPWPAGDAPAPEAVRDALAGQAGTLGLETLAPPDGVAWAAVLRSATAEAPLLVWVEPARGEPGWLVGVQTALDPAQPVEALAGVLRLVAAAFPDAPELIDTDTGLRVPRETFARDDAALAGLAWCVRVAHDGRHAWVHTQGLRRAGRPELEMLMVPLEHASAAMEVLDAIAGRIVDEPRPAPGATVEIGPGVPAVLRRWADVAPHLPPAAPGGEPGPDPDGRAVVGGPGDDERTWPATAVRRVGAGEVGLYRSRRESHGHAATARGTWPHLAGAHAAWSAADPRRRRAATFLVQASFDAPGTGDVQREHLWFQVETFDGDLATGRLVNAPRLATRLRADGVYRIGRDQVSDWQVVTDAGTAGPHRADALAPLLGITAP